MTVLALHDGHVLMCRCFSLHFLWGLAAAARLPFVCCAGLVISLSSCLALRLLSDSFVPLNDGSLFVHY